MPEVEYEVIKELGVLSTSSNGWETQLNIIKWGNNKPKYDLRTWGPGRSRAGKGLTLSNEEAVMLIDLLHKDLFEEQ